MAENQYVNKENDQIEITAAGYEYLSPIVTDTTGDVYAFTPQANSVIVAAAMARLSRRMGGLRETVLDEFTISGDKAEGVIERVVTGFGDDSVQQLATVQYVVEGASNLLTKLLEWGRFSSYLEQSTRYIFFDKRDKNGKYMYYVPTELTPEIRGQYVSSMDMIFNSYSSMVRGLTEYLRKKHPEPSEKSERIAWMNSTRAQACDAVRTVLPAATRSTVGIVSSCQAAESLIIHLLSDPLPEARQVGQQILNNLRQVIPVFLQRADMPDRGGATTAYMANTQQSMRDLTQKYLGYKLHGFEEETVSLHWYEPKNELSLVPEMLFRYATWRSLREIENAVAGWSQERMIEVFNAYIGERLNRRHRPGRALEKAHFEWEIVGDYGTFRDLQRHRVVDAMEWPQLTPYYGYSMPDLIAEAGMEEEYRRCFDLSCDLHQVMCNQGFEYEAQYATLLGHRMRYRFILNLRAMFHFLELRTHPTGHPGYRRICNEMHRQLSEVYPLSAAAMTFVNCDPDPELTRLSSERYTQYKLQKINES
jgi:thymidylate synthase ThyX